MARSYRGRRRGYGRRYWRRTGWWRRFGRRSGNSFTSGRRRMTLRVPVEAQAQFTIAAGENWSTLGCIQPYAAYRSSSASRGLSICALVSSPLYRRYAELFDEVKVDSVYVNGSIIDGIGISGVFSALSFCSAWDRKIQPGEILPGGKPGVTPRTIQFGSESQSFLLTNNSKQIVHRWNRASDLQERSIFHDCTVTEADETVQFSFYDQAFINGDIATVPPVVNIGYVPGLWMAFYSPLVNSAASRSVNVTFKVVYTVTFRNPKYGLSAETSGSKREVIEESFAKDGEIKVVDSKLGERKGDVDMLKGLLHEDVQLPLTDVAVKSESESVQPPLTGMAKAAMARLVAFYDHGDVPEYASGENDWREDLEFLVSKIGIDGFRSYISEGECKVYDGYLRDHYDMFDDEKGS